MKLRPGTLDDAVRELLALSLHLNWSFSGHPGRKLGQQQVLAFALSQSVRLKRLEERESAVGMQSMHFKSATLTTRTSPN